MAKYTIFHVCALTLCACAYTAHGMISHDENNNMKRKREHQQPTSTCETAARKQACTVHKSLDRAICNERVWDTLYHLTHKNINVGYFLRRTYDANASEAYITSVLNNKVYVNRYHGRRVFNLERISEFLGLCIEDRNRQPHPIFPKYSTPFLKRLCREVNDTLQTKEECQPTNWISVVCGLIERGNVEALQELSYEIRRQYSDRLIDGLNRLEAQKFQEPHYKVVRDLLALFPKVTRNGLYPLTVYKLSRHNPWNASYESFVMRYALQHVEDQHDVINAYSSHESNREAIPEAREGKGSDLVLEVKRALKGGIPLPKNYTAPSTQEDHFEDVLPYLYNMGAREENCTHDEKMYGASQSPQQEERAVTETLFNACVNAATYKQQSSDPGSTIGAVQSRSDIQPNVYHRILTQLLQTMISRMRRPGGILTHEIRAVCQHFPEIAHMQDENGETLLHGLARSPHFTHAMPLICAYSFNKQHGGNIRLEQLGFPVELPSRELDVEPADSVIGKAHASKNYEFRDMMRTYRQLSLIDPPSHLRNLRSRFEHLKLSPRTLEYHMRNRASKNGLPHDVKMRILRFLFALPLPQE